MTSSKRKFQVQKIDDKRYKLDVRGLTCPYPQLLTVRGLSRLAGDDLLEVLVDNPPSVKEIPPILEQKGYNVSTSRLNSSTWELKVKARKTVEKAL